MDHLVDHPVVLHEVRQGEVHHGGHPAVHHEAHLAVVRQAVAHLVHQASVVHQGRLVAPRVERPCRSALAS